MKEQYKLKKGCGFRDNSEIDHLNLSLDVQSVLNKSESPKDFFMNLVEYLRNRPAIALYRGVSNKELASEYLALTTLNDIVRSSRKKGAVKAFQRCVANKESEKQIKKLGDAMLKSIEHGEVPINNIHFGFDNRGNMMLDFGNDILDEAIIDTHIDGHA